MSVPPGSTGVEPASEGLRVGSVPRERRGPPEMGDCLSLENQPMRQLLKMMDCEEACVTKGR